MLGHKLQIEVLIMKKQ